MIMSSRRTAGAVSGRGTHRNARARIRVQYIAWTGLIQPSPARCSSPRLQQPCRCAGAGIDIGSGTLQLLRPASSINLSLQLPTASAASRGASANRCNNYTTPEDYHGPGYTFQLDTVFSRLPSASGVQLPTPDSLARERLSIRPSSFPCCPDRGPS